MNCPLCTDTVLDVTYHGGIEVDICPRCRGVWLDRGELERLVADRPAPPRPAEPTFHRPDGRISAPDGASASGSTTESKKGKKKDRKRRLADRLGDVFEEVLDL